MNKMQINKLMKKCWQIPSKILITVMQLKSHYHYCYTVIYL